MTGRSGSRGNVTYKKVRFPGECEEFTWWRNGYDECAQKSRSWRPLRLSETVSIESRCEFGSRTAQLGSGGDFTMAA